MTFVVSDIHGREDRFDTILDQIEFSDNDSLYILGDVIDRNPDGISLLKRIMKMTNAHMLLGNHELMMLEACKNPGFANMGRWYWNGGQTTYEQFSALPEYDQKEILDYIESLPLNLEVTVNGINYLLVHGIPEDSVLQCNYERYDNLLQAIVWVRISDETPIPDDKIVIFGHTPTDHYQDKHPLQIWCGDHRIGIDCGAAYSHGRLACLRLDDMKVFYSVDV